MRNRKALPFALTFGFGLCGCATVDPRADYRQWASHVAEVTGQSVSADPADEESAAQRVRELTAGRLTVEAAVQVALLNNPRLQAAFRGIGIGRAEAVQAGLLSNPSLSVSVRFPSGGGLANVDTALTQRLADLWLRPAKKRAAEGEVNRLILEIARQASVLASDTRGAFCRAVGAGRVLSILQENRDVAQQLLDAAVARREAGSGNEIDVNLARSEFMETELAVLESKSSAFDRRRELVTLLGLSLAPDELQLTDDLPDLSALNLTVEALIEFAQVNRLDVRAMDQAVQSAAARLDLERRSVWRFVELGVGLERAERGPATERDYLSDAAQSSLESGAVSLPPLFLPNDEATDLIVGPEARVELPLFDQNQAQIAKAQFVHEQTLKLREALVLEVIQETRGSHQRATTKWEVSNYYRANVLPLRERNLELSREAYRSGRLAFLSVLEAQRTLLQARARFVETLGETASAFAELEKVTGVPLVRLIDSLRPNAPTTENP